MVPSTASFSSARSPPSLLTTSSTASTPAFHDQNHLSHSTSSTPSAVRMIEGGVSGIQYSIVDPDVQYQKFLIVVIQALSGTDPLRPPMYNPRLTDGGTVLEVSIPVSEVFSKANLLVHRNATWMMDDVGYYENRKQTRLGGLGPTIAQANSHFRGQPWTTVWRVPLVAPCDEIIGNYSITNFPTYMNEASQKHYPVLIEFKLKTIEQSVKKEAAINYGVWDESSGSSSEEFCSAPISRRRKRTKRGRKGAYKDP